MMCEGAYMPLNLSYQTVILICVVGVCIVHGFVQSVRRVR
jgi:hypothetical protein